MNITGLLHEFKSQAGQTDNPLILELISKPYRMVYLHFIPDMSPDEQYPVVKCGNRLMVSDNKAMPAALLQVQFGSENTMVLANRSGNLIGRLLHEVGGSLKYYTLRQYDFIEVEDVVKLQAVKGDNGYYTVRLKGFDLGSPGSESWFTLAMRLSSHCGDSNTTHELILIPTGKKSPDFVPGKLVVTATTDQYKPDKILPDEQHTSREKNPWVIVGIILIVLLTLLLLIFAIFFSVRAYQNCRSKNVNEI